MGEGEGRSRGGIGKEGSRGEGEEERRRGGEDTYILFLEVHCPVILKYLQFVSNFAKHIIPLFLPMMNNFKSSHLRSSCFLFPLLSFSFPSLLTLLSLPLAFIPSQASRYELYKVMPLLSSLSFGC